MLERSDGAWLTIGIGAPASVLALGDDTGNSFHSIGEVGKPGHLLFWTRGAAQEYDAEQAVPIEAALTAAEEFVRGMVPPPSVPWESDW